MLCFIISCLTVAVVTSSDFHCNLFLIKQTEGYRIDKALPPCALFDLDLTDRFNSILYEIAVLGMANRTYRLLEIACFAVVFAAVMGAGIIALGADAVLICMGMRLYYCFVFVIEACCIAVPLAAIGKPIAVISNVYILAVFVKEHAAVVKRLAKSVIVLLFTHSCED